MSIIFRSAIVAAVCLWATALANSDEIQGRSIDETVIGEKDALAMDIERLRNDYYDPCLIPCTEPVHNLDNRSPRYFGRPSSGKYKWTAFGRGKRSPRRTSGRHYYPGDGWKYSAFGRNNHYRG